MNRDHPLSGCSVLVVEDNYILAMDICEWLDGAGAAVIGPVPDAEQALAKLDVDSVELAVIDINLGQGPTFEVADRLARERIPFLFATGYDQSAIPKNFASAPRLEKPFNGAELIAAILALHQNASAEELSSPAERPT